jgi:hypothetical protein
MTRVYAEYDNIPDEKLEEYLAKELILDIPRGRLPSDLYIEMVDKMILPNSMRKNIGKYRIIKEYGCCSGRTYYVVQKKFLWFWYHPDKEGCAVHPGDLSKTPRQHDTIEEAKRSIELMENHK